MICVLFAAGQSVGTGPPVELALLLLLPTCGTVLAGMDPEDMLVEVAGLLFVLLGLCKLEELDIEVLLKTREVEVPLLEEKPLV